MPMSMNRGRPKKRPEGIRFCNFSIHVNVLDQLTELDEETTSNRVRSAKIRQRIEEAVASLFAKDHVLGRFLFDVHVEE